MMIHITIDRGLILGVYKYKREALAHMHEQNICGSDNSDTCVESISLTTGTRRCKWLRKQRRELK